jgi:hypothetical protein
MDNTERGRGRKLHDDDTPSPARRVAGEDAAGARHAIA